MARLTHPVLILMAILATTQTSFADELKVIASHTPVIGRLGDDVDLGCHLVPAVSAENMTIRFHVGDLIIYVYDKTPGEFYTQNEKYKNRTELLSENIQRGQVTVRIKNIQVSDKGKYICEFASVGSATLEIKVVDELKVIASHTPVIGRLGDDVDLGCHLVPAVSAEDMTIRFYVGDLNIYVYGKTPGEFYIQNEKYKNRTELLTENITQGQVTVRIKNIQVSDAGKYICEFASVGSATLEIKVAEDSLKSWQIALIVLGYFAAVGALVGCLYIYKKKQRAEHVLPLADIFTPRSP